MGQYVYWHAPLWEVLLACTALLGLLIWLTARVLRRPDLHTALSSIDPALTTLPLLFFDQVRGITCLNTAAEDLMRRLAENPDSTNRNTLTETLNRVYAQGQVVQHEDWPEEGHTLVVNPIAASSRTTKGVLALIVHEYPEPPQPITDVTEEPKAWIVIGTSVQIHATRPVVRTQMNHNKEGNGALKWQEQPLSHLEEILLRYLLDHSTEVQTVEILFKVVWPDDPVEGYGLRAEQRDRLRRLIYQLRQHIEPDPGNPRFIITAHGAGYALYPEQEVTIP